ncbi:hypothetical protein [Marinactinospora rubrisoli]|uniref:Secreted protein n=1 Tax=Marinactinospora rubrisoli TaxID=2715399 RepID=A0ABW2KNG4_9ACTN
MKRVVSLLAALVAAVGLAMVPTTANAEIEQAAACRPWYDSRTFGVSCSGGPYIAVAQCTNGRTVQGASASNGSWSYAYCATVGSNYRIGTGYGLYI